MRTGELAAAAGVNRQTLRYYERRGLLPAPSRSPGGHRRYPPSALAVLTAIRAAQRLGFRLDEIAALLRDDHTLRTRADAKLTELTARIADLQAAADTLRTALEAGCDDLTTCATEPACPLTGDR